VNYKFDFVTRKKLFFSISIAIISLGILSLFLFGLNLGTDFRSGSRLDIDLGTQFKQEDIMKILETTQQTAKSEGISVDLTPSVIRSAGNDNEIAVLNFDKTIDADILPILKAEFAKVYGEKVGVQENTVDPTRSKELAIKAIYAVLWASLGIVIYVTLRFEFRFAIAAIIALLHDAFFVVGAFSLLRLEVDLTFIAAVLTIVGYSINDTIVLFDRIRENLKNTKVKKAEDLENLVNLSLNQTLTRSINTVLTVVFAAVALFIFAGEGVHNFSLALILGLISGTYSSIFIASQIWLLWKERDLKRKKLQPQTEA